LALHASRLPKMPKKKRLFFQKRLDEAIGERMQNGGSDGYITEALEREYQMVPVIVAATLKE